VNRLSRYQSEFFGRLREVLGESPDIRVEGDRFVFSSELLFASGTADLGERGRTQLVRFAATLRELAARIPDDLDWVLRVDGHTDRVPIRTARYASNWELSTDPATTAGRRGFRRVPPARSRQLANRAGAQPAHRVQADLALGRGLRVGRSWPEAEACGWAVRGLGAAATPNPVGRSAAHGAM
jgi:chemotaxis protein MotB